MIRANRQRAERGVPVFCDCHDLSLISHDYITIYNICGDIWWYLALSISRTDPICDHRPKIWRCWSWMHDNAWIVTAIHLIHLRSIQILFLELRISRHHGLAPSAPACSSWTLPPWMTHWSWPKFIVCRGGKSSQSVQCLQCCLVKSGLWCFGPVIINSV